MSTKKDATRCEADSDLQREIIEGRKFTLEEAIARMVGPGAMKGESPVPRLRQAEIEIETWLGLHVTDAAGALCVILKRQISGSELLLNNFEHPLAVLSDYCRHVCDSSYHLEQLVREADVEWGRLMDERPHFELGGAAPDAEDPYTIESVHQALIAIIEQLANVAP